MGQKQSTFNTVLKKLEKMKNDTCYYVVKEFTTFMENGKDSITIALVGKTGVGKSRLLNALIGEFKAGEGNKLVAGTTKAALYQTTKHEIKINIWDTPGVEDGSEHEESYLQQIADNIKDIDLLLYCTSMADRRFRPQDAKAIEKVIEKLGVEIWKNAMIVLTFANEVQPSSSYNGTKEEYFKERLKLFTDAHHDCLKENGVKCDVECVPAGDIGKQALPICEDWLPVFWLMAFKYANQRVKPALLQTNHERLKFPSLPKEAYNEAKKGDIPFILNEKQEMRLWEMTTPPASRTAKLFAQIRAVFLGFDELVTFGAAGGFVYGVIKGLCKYYALKKAEDKVAVENNSDEDGADAKTESKSKPKLPKPSDQSSTTANPDSLSTSLSTLHLSIGNEDSTAGQIQAQKESEPVHPSDGYERVQILHVPTEDNACF